jgi:hypothetical protein
MQDRRWCTIEGVYKAYNQMDWYLSKVRWQFGVTQR